jgi:hypothetical protein
MLLSLHETLSEIVYNLSMWPQLPSRLEHFFLSLSLLLLSWCALDLATHIRIASARKVASRLTRPVTVSAACVPRPRLSLALILCPCSGDPGRMRDASGRLSPGALHVRCAAGYVMREAVSPQTTFSPCWRRGRQAPHPVCALRRLVQVPIEKGWKNWQYGG